MFNMHVPIYVYIHIYLYIYIYTCVRNVYVYIYIILNTAMLLHIATVRIHRSSWFHPHPLPPQLSGSVELQGDDSDDGGHDALPAGVCRLGGESSQSFKKSASQET